MLTLNELVAAYHALAPSDQQAVRQEISRRGPVPRHPHPVSQAARVVVAAYRALSESNQQAVRGKLISRRGPKPPQSEPTRQATWNALVGRTTSHLMPQDERLWGAVGEFFDEWLLELTPDQLERLQGYPTLEELKKLEASLKKKPERWLSEEELSRLAAGPPRNELSLLSWLWTVEGWAVFKRKGLERFYEWAELQTEKLIEFKALNMQRLIKLKNGLYGRKPKRTRGAEFAYVQHTKDEFFKTVGFTLNQIPPRLRSKNS